MLYVTQKSLVDSQVSASETWENWLEFAQAINILLFSYLKLQNSQIRCNMKFSVL